jgi:RNA polymerase sigma-70 factor, ECF subfamily
MGLIDPQVLGRLFDAHADALVLYARQWTDSAEDVVQDAFLALARQGNFPERAIAWLHRAVRNGAIDASRRAGRRRKREEHGARPEVWFAATDDAIDAARASQALGSLAAELRETIVARLWGGLTFEEVAKLQGCSLTTAHRRYQAGLQVLQERLDPSCPNSKQATSSKLG